MKNNGIYILGAGAMARETYQIYIDQQRRNVIKGFVVNKKPGIPADIWDKKIFSEETLKGDAVNIRLIGGIGTPLRKNWLQKLTKKGYKFDTAVHKTVLVGYNTKIGLGTIICAGATLTCDIVVGKHTVINNNATINHDCRIGDFVTIGPGVNVGGRVCVGDGSFLGIGAIIAHNIKIGRNVFIGAGSVVVKNIPDGVLAYGSPAKPVRRLTKKDWNNLI